MVLHRGRLPAQVNITEVRPMTPDDLALITQKRTLPVVARFRDPHHHVARLIASGLRPAEVATRSGYSMARIYTLQADPSFQELLAQYREKAIEGFIESQDEYYSLATSNMLKAERQLSERLDAADEAGELLPVKDLISISRDAADRFGYGKKTTNLNVNVDFAAKLEAAAAKSSAIIEGRALPTNDSVGALPPLRRRA